MVSPNIAEQLEKCKESITFIECRIRGPLISDTYRSRLEKRLETQQQKVSHLLAERDRLIHSCLNVVHHVAIKFHRMNRNLDYDDLVGAGMIGLILAAEYFRPNTVSKGRVVTFCTYATASVRSRIIHECKRQRSIIHIPESSKFTGDIDKATKILNLGYVYRDGYESQTGYIEDRPQYNTEEMDALKEQLHILEKNPHTSRYAQVIRLRYLNDGDEEMTLHQIGTIMGISKERVRQLEAKAFKWLRKHLVTAIEEGI